MLIGCARVSTADRNPDHQIDALLRHGVERGNIHIDTASGAKASRPKLDLALQVLRADDPLKITRLDRLDRLDRLSPVRPPPGHPRRRLRERGIGLHVIEHNIDTATMEGRAMFGMLSVLAELQRERIVANTMDGPAAARARGRTGRRRPSLTEDQATEDQAALAQRLYDAREKTVQQIADLFGVPRSTATSTGRKPSPAGPGNTTKPDRYFAPRAGDRSPGPS